jgi:hypothetical protein
MTTEQSDGACTPSFSSAELERTAFERWYSNDGQWSNGIERSGDGYKYQGADHAWRVWQVAVKFEREACARIAETPISGEQDDITMAAKDRVAKAIRMRSNAVADSRPD